MADHNPSLPLQQQVLYSASALFHINFDANLIASGESGAPGAEAYTILYGYVQYMDELVHRAKSKQQLRKCIPSAAGNVAN